VATTPVLPERLFRALPPGLPAVLITVDEDGFGYAVMTWAVALRPDRMRFVADHRSRTLANLLRTGKASVEIIARDNALAMVKGAVRQVRERVGAAPFGMAMWEMSVADIRDQTWEHVVVSPLTFEWVGAKADEMRCIEQAVLAELREWRSGA
jgi:hypothetical protein